jgi:hypothetical protein
MINEGILDKMTIFFSRFESLLIKRPIHNYNYQININ